jgi:hypothetical protein
MIASARYPLLQELMAVSDPCLPPGTSMLVQVPPRTNFHALPWKSIVEVPWQVVPGPAAQSFCPFNATPKHFSLWAAVAAAASSLDSGEAAAIVATAVATALARTAELTMDLTDMTEISK